MAWSRTQAERKHSIITLPTGKLITSMFKAFQEDGEYSLDFFHAQEELNERFKSIDEPRIEQLNHDWAEKWKDEQS